MLDMLDIVVGEDEFIEEEEEEIGTVNVAEGGR